MSKVTKNFRKLASTLTAVLVATLIPVSASSPASAAPIAGSLSVTREFNTITNSFQAYSGERLNVYFSYEVDMISVDEGDILSFDDLENDIAGLSAEWTINNNWMNRVTASSYTVPSEKPTSISLNVNKTLTPSATGLVKFNPVVTTSGDTLTASRTYKGVSLNFSRTTTDYTAKAGDQTLYFYGNACVDMTKVVAGDDLLASTTLTGSATPNLDGSSSSFWSSGFGIELNAISPQTELERTVPNPEPSEIKFTFDRSFSGLTTGSKYSFSTDIKKGGTSVAITCPNIAGPPPGLFPIGGASVTGTFSIGSKITVTPNQWSLTNGGAIDATVTTDYDWYLCATPLTASTTDFMQIECIQDLPEQVLANGTSIGFTNGPNQGFTGASLTITQGLLTAMTGKHLMVIVNGKKGADMMAKRGDLFMKTCGPIASGSTCSSTYGTAVAPTKKTPKAATVTTRLKIGRTITVGLHTTKGTAAKGANADGLATVVSIATASKKICTATKIVKNKKITGYTIKGLKAGKCSVVVAISGSSSFNALTRTTSVTVSK
jgi:hypothetical protein